MLAKPERLIGEIGDLNSKLILLVGPSRSGKTQLLRQLGAKLNIESLNVGLELGRRLAATPNNKRGFSAGELLREIADKERTEDPLLLDNLELLFEPSLQINPLDLVRRLAHSKRVVAVWPGDQLQAKLLTAIEQGNQQHSAIERENEALREQVKSLGARIVDLEAAQHVGDQASKETSASRRATSPGSTLPPP